MSLVTPETKRYCHILSNQSYGWVWAAVWKPSLGSLKEQQMLLPTDPSLHRSLVICDNVTHVQNVFWSYSFPLLLLAPSRSTSITYPSQLWVLILKNNSQIPICAAHILIGMGIILWSRVDLLLGPRPLNKNWVSLFQKSSTVNHSSAQSHILKHIHFKCLLSV